MDVSVFVRGEAGYGSWLDLNDYDNVDELVSDADAATYDDGFQIIDTESDYDLGDPMSLADVWDRMKVIGDSDEPEAMASYLSYHGWYTDYAKSTFETAYRGKWDSLEDYAIDFYEQVYGYFDVPGYTILVDLPTWESSHFTVDTDNGVHVFRGV